MKQLTAAQITPICNCVLGELLPEETQVGSIFLPEKIRHSGDRPDEKPANWHQIGQAATENSFYKLPTDFAAKVRVLKVGPTAYGIKKGMVLHLWRTYFPDKAWINEDKNLILFPATPEFVVGYYESP